MLIFYADDAPLLIVVQLYYNHATHRLYCKYAEWQRQAHLLPFQPCCMHYRSSGAVHSGIWAHTSIKSASTNLSTHSKAMSQLLSFTVHHLIIVRCSKTQACKRESTKPLTAWGAGAHLFHSLCIVLVLVFVHVFQAKGTLQGMWATRAPSSSEEAISHPLTLEKHLFSHHSGMWYEAGSLFWWVSLTVHSWGLAGAASHMLTQERVTRDAQAHAHAGLACFDQNPP